MEEEQKILADDSDDDLPELFINNSNNSTSDIAAGDIVWAEFRKLYWPSLVRTVYKKAKKASIWYLDSPKKCFKVPFRRIKSFSDAEVGVEIRKEIENSPVSMKSLHRKVYLNALTYMRRQAEGHKDDPAAYFDLTQHYLAYKNLNIPMPKRQSNFTNEQPNEFCPNNSDEEVISEEEEDDDFGMEKKMSKFYYVEDENDDDPKTDAITNYITSGHLDKYLLQVKNKKVQSEYQNFYERAMQTDRRELFKISACSIVKSLKKLREISIYLMDYYEKIVEGGKCEMVDYITSVWLPEAIDEAVRSIDKTPAQSENEVKRQLFVKEASENITSTTESNEDIDTELEGKAGVSNGDKKSHKWKQKRTKSKKSTNSKRSKRK